VKILCRVIRVLTAQGQEIVEWDAEFVLSVPPKVGRDQGRCETVKACSHRRVGGEEIPSARYRQGDLEGLSGLAHKTARAF
jgi:hypothetical protein